MTTSPDRIGIDERTRLLVLTGAGISAESGLATFRGAGGLWEGRRIEEVASPEGFEVDPALVWAFYAARRAAAAAAEPNAAHRALAAAEQRMGERFLLVTQNVDGLHARAGSHALELHGSLWRTRCHDCDRPAFDDASIPTEPPRCDRCGGRLRPAIVWFGENVDQETDRRTRRFLQAATLGGHRLVFLAIGTSGNVYPASMMVRYAADLGAETWLANLDPAANAGEFDHVVLGPATISVPALLR